MEENGSQRCLQLEVADTDGSTPRPFVVAAADICRSRPQLLCGFELESRRKGSLHLLCTISVRGDALPLLMALHMSLPSTGIGPVLSIFAGGRPAMAATVGYQSITCIILTARSLVRL